MDLLLHVIESYGLWVVFICVILDQGGLPLPAYPPMIVTAGLAVDAHASLAPILIVATLGALLADLLWYAGGRRFGATLLRLMCRLSLSADSCVGMTRRIYGRWGAPSLIVSKYVPGFAAVATTLAGESGTSLRGFLLYDGIGALLWAAGAVALGAIFHEAVAAVLLELENLGHYAVIMLVAAIALFIVAKWWQRHRFLMKIKMARISAADLGALLASGATAKVLDVRTSDRRALSGWIPGSIEVHDVAELGLTPDDDVIVYCDCPNDASAAIMVAKLRKQGILRARPLAGGIDAWRERGLPLEQADIREAS